MGVIVWKSLLLCFLYGAVSSADVFLSPLDPIPDVCLPVQLSGVEWIIHVREPNYGWNGNTHRANIALAVNGWRGQPEEMAKMELQLQEEIINSLLSSSPIHENDLALFIHALVATKKNPRNFHGQDLVQDLLNIVNANENVHPFLVLVLCNAHAVEFEHLEKIKKYTVHSDINSTLQAKEAEMKALALKAFACAASLPDARERNLDKFGHAMEEASKCLISKQADGIFGNAYTTSLAVQALTAYGKKWDDTKSLDFLRKESAINVSMLKTYYIEMALNARKVKFLKDLYAGPYDPEKKEATPKLYTTYTIKDEQDPDLIFTVIMKIPHDWNFFQVMERASRLSNRFNFSYVVNKNKEPLVFQVIGKPNDAEENMFWMICRQNNINHDPHTSNITTFSDSPVKLRPLEGEHIMLWYRSSDCPQS